MKQSNIVMMSAAALVALVAVSGVALMTYAQSSSTNTAAETNNTIGQFGQSRGMFNWSNLTDEQKAEMEAQREAKRAEMEAKRDEMNTAIASGYESWLAEVKESMGENAPILSKINADNFSQFAKAHSLMEEARSIMAEIGLEGEGFGPGGFGGRGGKMGGGGRGGCHGLDAPASIDAQAGNTD